MISAKNREHSFAHFTLPEGLIKGTWHKQAWYLFWNSTYFSNETLKQVQGDMDGGIRIPETILK